MDVRVRAADDRQCRKAILQMGNKARRSDVPIDVQVISARAKLRSRGGVVGEP